MSKNEKLAMAIAAGVGVYLVIQLELFRQELKRINTVAERVAPVLEKFGRVMP